MNMPELLLTNARPRRSEAWIAIVILFVVGVGLWVGGPPLRIAHKPRPATAMMVPNRPADVATLLNATPLAIAPEDALAINAARPIDRLKVPAARPFQLPAPTPEQTLGTNAALDCLTKAVYYEAAVESETGQRAVAQVVLNRMRSPIFPHSVCGVVFQGSELRTGCQFSFTCDGSLLRQPSLAGWMRARRVALAALTGHVEPSVGLATHYHANYVVPYWASSLDKVSTLGAHIFYTMRGGLGRPGAFRAAYDGQSETSTELSAQISANEPGAFDQTDVINAPTNTESFDRTVVREDAIGSLNAGNDIAPKGSALKLLADDTSRKIVADDRKGQLKTE